MAAIDATLGRLVVYALALYLRWHCWRADRRMARVMRHLRATLGLALALALAGCALCGHGPASVFCSAEQAGYSTPPARPHGPGHTWWRHTWCSEVGYAIACGPDPDQWQDCRELRRSCANWRLP